MATLEDMQEQCEECGVDMEIGQIGECDECMDCSTPDEHVDDPSPQL